MGQALPDEHAHQVRLVERGLEVGDVDVGEREAGLVDARLPGVPALDELPVEALLAAEVVRDQLGVDACPLGDLADPCPGVALVGELSQGGVEDARPGPLRVPQALARLGRAARAPRTPSRSPVGGLRCGIAHTPQGTRSSDDASITWMKLSISGLTSII